MARLLAAENYETRWGENQKTFYGRHPLGINRLLMGTHPRHRGVGNYRPRALLHTMRINNLFTGKHILREQTFESTTA